MNIIKIIEKKKDGLRLSDSEIQYWIDGLVDGSIPDYQTSALLMAIAINGMDDEETTQLTLSMMNSGDQIDLSAIAGIKVDKHSTGGVGDKTSIILGPIVAAAGGKVPKMSGRGLGHTGGTLDKLESIPGFSIEMSNAEFINQVNAINLAIVGQNNQLVYADKVLYALRDVTGTVASIPLIASSIMSKKLAGGADAIVLDVKYGHGAFMKTVEEAKQLAETMIAIGQGLGRDVSALISNMNQPLGNTIGNALEIYESALTLQNKGPKDLETLCLKAASEMIYHSNLAQNKEQAFKQAEEVLRNGQAYERFLVWIESQKGDVSVFDNLETFIESNYTEKVVASKSGYLHEIKALSLGQISLELGAGRHQVDDELDYKAGIILHKNTGDFVQEGDVLAELKSSNVINSELMKNTMNSFVLKNDKPTRSELLAAVL